MAIGRVKENDLALFCEKSLLDSSTGCPDGPRKDGAVFQIGHTDGGSGCRRGGIPVCFQTRSGQRLSPRVSPRAPATNLINGHPSTMASTPHITPCQQPKIPPEAPQFLPVARPRRGINTLRRVWHALYMTGSNTRGSLVRARISRISVALVHHQAAFFGHEQRRFWHIAIMVVDTCFQFSGAQESVWLRDRPLAMDSLGLHRVQPRPFTGSPHDTIRTPARSA
jgi:hypothetical protein